jgi:hypothetical protein
MPVDTTVDRSLVIALERKAPSQASTPLLADEVPTRYATERRQIRRWAADHSGALRQAQPARPEGLHDRAWDNGRPLLAIADLAGGPWPEWTRQALIALSNQDPDFDPMSEQALRDLRVIFIDPDTAFPTLAKDCLTTKCAVELLVGLDSRPWATYHRKTQKPLTQHQLARILKGFKVKPTKVKLHGKSENCYVKAELEPAWDRYVPSTPPNQVGTLEPANVYGPESTISGWNRHKPGSDLKCEESSINPGTVPRFQPETGGAQGEDAKTADLGSHPDLDWRDPEEKTDEQF